MMKMGLDLSNMSHCKIRKIVYSFPHQNLLHGAVGHGGLLVWKHSLSLGNFLYIRAHTLLLGKRSSSSSSVQHCVVSSISREVFELQQSPRATLVRTAARIFNWGCRSCRAEAAAARLQKYYYSLLLLYYLHRYRVCFASVAAAVSSKTV